MSELEIILQVDVIPLGTLDLHDLDAPAGTPSPAVEVDASGRVTYLDAARAAQASAPQQREGVSEEAETLPPTTLAPEVVAQLAAATAAAEAAEAISASSATPDPTSSLANVAPQATVELPRPEQAAASAPQPTVELPREREPLVDPSAREPVHFPEGSGPLDTAAAAANLAANTAALDEPRANLSELDAAAGAPIPPRPDAANRELVVSPVGPPLTDFDTDLDSTTSFFDAAKYLLWLLLLPLGLGVLLLYLTERLPGMQVAEAPKPSASPSKAAPSPSPISIAVVPRPSTQPSAQPSTQPSAQPSVQPSTQPSLQPSPEPSAEPSAAPSVAPSLAPSPEPSPSASPEPSVAPSPAASPAPSVAPSPAPSVAPSPEQPDLGELRELAKDTETGVVVGTEEDEPGLVARLESLRSESEASLDAGDVDAARRALTALLEDLPDDPHAHFLLGRVHELDSEPEAARAAYERSIELNPKDPRPLNNLALMTLDAGDTAGARALLQRGLSVAPENADVLTNLANLDAATRPAQAHALYSKALAKRMRHSPARLGRGQVRERLGDTQGARSDYEALVAYDDPLAPQALDGLGRLARRAGDPHMAVAFHQRALAAKNDPGFRTNLGISLLETNQPRKALVELEQAAKELPQSKITLVALGTACLRLAKDDPRYLGQAKSAYEAAIKLDPEDWRTRYHYARLAEQAGKFDVALRHFEIAVHLSPAATPAAMSLAAIYDQTGKPAKAIKVLTKALKAAPDEPELHLLHARVLAGQERPIEARTAMRAFLKHAAKDDPRRKQVEAQLPEHGE